MAGRFLAGLAHCLQSVEWYSSVPEKLGVTLLAADGQLQLFSTDNVTMARATMPLPRGHAFEQRCILSGDFCKEMLRLAKQARVVRFALASTMEDGTYTHALLAADDVLLFGHLLTPDPDKGPLDYVTTINRHLPAGYAEQAVAIPHRSFAPALRRLERIVGIIGTEPYTRITVERGQPIHGSSERGSITEELHLPGHFDVKLKVRVSNLGKALKAFAPDKILFTKQAIVLARGDLLHMVATGAGE